MNRLPPPAPSVSSSGQGLGGSALILLSKIWFIIASWGIYIGLSRILGVDGFGRYGVVVGLVTVINMCFIKGTLQAVSKFVSEDPARAAGIKCQALKIQLGMGGGSFLLFFGLSGPIAARLRDPALAPYLRLAAFIILFYSFYAVFIGVLNGRREFTTQAVFDMSYSTLKAVLMLGLAYFSYLKGAITGFAIAAGLVLIGSSFVVGWRRAPASFPLRKIRNFMIPIMLLTLVIHLTMTYDLLLLKRYSAPARAEDYAGWYTAVQTLARLPFMIVASALVLVLFPFVSHSSFSKNREQTRRYIRQGMRLAYLVILPGTVVIASSPRATIGLIYGSAYQAGAPALIWLAPAYLFFSFFVISLTLITASGRPGHSLLLALAVFAVQWDALLICLRTLGFPGAALASAIAFFFGSWMGGMYLTRRLGAFLELKTFLRITAAGAITFLISRLVPVSGFRLLVKDVMLAAVFVGGLIGLRELGRADLDTLRATLPLGRRKGPGAVGGA